MPFTPFHFGPGLLIKGLIPARFSLSMFALANVAMDVEPLYHMLRGDAQVHGATHTLLGAGLIGVGTALWGRSILRGAWRLYERCSANAGTSFCITRQQAWLGALLGTFSHVLLDAVMHVDVHPFLPLTDDNPWLDISCTEHVYFGCVLAGMVGLLLVLIRAGFSPEPTHNQ
jgi:membrane-bound metal-dependent hydrolase YbcI (DUF457 family)